MLMDSQANEQRGMPAAWPPEGGKEGCGEPEVHLPADSPSDQRFREFRNSDNGRLLPRKFGSFVVGYIDEVCGPEAEEVRAYVPTRHELVQLVKYWYGRILHDNWAYFITSQTGSSEARLCAFSKNRIFRAQAAIGKEAVDRAIKEVSEEFRTKVVKDDRLWEVFEHGTAEQRDAVVEETHRNMREEDALERTRSG
jgi:hypothetical protein